MKIKTKSNKRNIYFFIAYNKKKYVYNQFKINLLYSSIELYIYYYFVYNQISILTLNIKILYLDIIYII